MPGTGMHEKIAESLGVCNESLRIPDDDTIASLEVSKMILGPGEFKDMLNFLDQSTPHFNKAQLIRIALRALADTAHNTNTKGDAWQCYLRSFV